MTTLSPTGTGATPLARIYETHCIPPPVVTVVTIF
jgi:hypothetical protein